MNLVVGSATNLSLQNHFAGGADPVNGIVDVEIDNFGGPGPTHYNLSKNGSASNDPLQVIFDDNAGGPTVDDTAFGGIINVVNTLPTLPPAVAP